MTEKKRKLYMSDGESFEEEIIAKKYRKTKKKDGKTIRKQCEESKKK